MSEDIVDFTKAHERMINHNKQKIEELLKYRKHCEEQHSLNSSHWAECDALHEQNLAHKKRTDDAINNLTASNILLTKAILDGSKATSESSVVNAKLAESILTIDGTISKLVEENKLNAPSIKKWQNLLVWIEGNKVFVAVIMCFAVLVTSVIAAYKALGMG